MSLYEAIPRWIIEIPNYLKTQELCIKAVRIEQLSLMYVPYHFRAKIMCEKTIEVGPWLLEYGH